MSTLGPQDVQAGVEGVGAHEHLGHEVLLAVEEFSHHFHAGGQAVHDAFVGVEALVHDGVGSGDHPVLVVLDDPVLELAEQLLLGLTYGPPVRLIRAGGAQLSFLPGG